MGQTTQLARRSLVAAAVALVAGGCTPEPGQVYALPLHEVRRVLAKIALPPMVFGTMPAQAPGAPPPVTFGNVPPMVFDTVPINLSSQPAPEFRVDASDPARIIAIVSRNHNEMLRYILTVTQVADQSTRVRVEIAGPKGGMFGDVERKLANNPALRGLHVEAMEEQVAATLLRRSFDLSKLYPAMRAADVANSGEARARATKEIEATQKRDRDNIAKAYADEAAGTPRR